MATIAITDELDVVDKYKELVCESLGSDSTYIRTKETLQEFFDNNNIKDTDKANIISSVLTSLNTALVSASMSTALQWAITEKDTALRKLELAKQLDVLDQDILIKESQADIAYRDNIAKQADIIRTYGAPIVVSGTVTSLPDEGKAYQDIELAKQQLENLGKESIILDTKEKEAEATVHKLIADTYVNYGKYTYTIDNTGLTSITDGTPVSHTPLSTAQLSIAEEQSKGYTYNAWANAINGASSFLGTAVAGEAAIFGTGQPGEAILADLEVSIDKLSKVVPPSF